MTSLTILITTTIIIWVALNSNGRLIYRTFSILADLCITTIIGIITISSDIDCITDIVWAFLIVITIITWTAITVDSTNTLSTYTNLRITTIWISIAGITNINSNTLITCTFLPGSAIIWWIAGWNRLRNWDWSWSWSWGNIICTSIWYTLLNISTISVKITVSTNANCNTLIILALLASYTTGTSITLWNWWSNRCNFHTITINTFTPKITSYFRTRINIVTFTFYTLLLMFTVFIKYTLWF